jgi:hypothetical protein
MQSPVESMSLNQRLKFIAFYIAFWIIGFIFAFWIGLGWLMLFETIQSLIFTFPRLYLLTLRLIFGKEFEEGEKFNMVKKGTYKVISWKLAIRTVISIALTILFFWKINIPLVEFVKIFFN